MKRTLVLEINGLQYWTETCLNEGRWTHLILPYLRLNSNCCIIREAYGNAPKKDTIYQYLVMLSKIAEKLPMIYNIQKM